MEDATTRADEMRDGESTIDLPRGVRSDQPAAIGDSITIRTGFGKIKATLLEVADPPLAGMELLPNVADMLFALKNRAEEGCKRRALAVKLRLRNLDSGPFDRNAAVIPVQMEWVLGSDGELVGGAHIKPGSLYPSAQVPEPGQPSSTGWVGFHLQTGVEPEAFILSFGSGAARWQLVRRVPNAEPRFEDVSRGALLEEINKGADLWNAWRRTRPHYEIDLAGADLKGLDLSEFDFSRVNLSGAHLSKAKLAGTRFSGAFLRGAGFHDCAEFTHCDFSGAD